MTFVQIVNRRRHRPLVSTALLAALALLPACRREAAPTAEARMLAAVAEVARSHADHLLAPREWKRGQPVMIDLVSFARAGRQISAAPLSDAAVRAALPRGFRAREKHLAVHCLVWALGCHVRGDGLYMRVNSVTPLPTGFAADVTYMWTDRGHSHEALGMAELRIEIRKSGGRWIVGPARMFGIS